MCNYSLSVTCHISATRCTYIYRHVKQVQICMTYTHTHTFLFYCAIEGIHLFALFGGRQPGGISMLLLAIHAFGTAAETNSKSTVSV